MNEKRIQEVIEVEQRALELLAQAKRESEQVPTKAEAEAAAILKDARTAAEDEAGRIIQQAKNGDEAAGIISRAQDDMNRFAGLAERNLEKAVAFVVDHVMGRA